MTISNVSYDKYQSPPKTSDNATGYQLDWIEAKSNRFIHTVALILSPTGITSIVSAIATVCLGMKMLYHSLASGYHSNNQTDLLKKIGKCSENEFDKLSKELSSSKNKFYYHIITLKKLEFDIQKVSLNIIPIVGSCINYYRHVCQHKEELNHAYTPKQQAELTLMAKGINSLDYQYSIAQRT